MSEIEKVDLQIAQEVANEAQKDREHDRKIMDDMLNQNRTIHKRNFIIILLLCGVILFSNLAWLLYEFNIERTTTIEYNSESETTIDGAKATSGGKVGNGE